MALFDQFGPAQASNGMAPQSPQMTSSAPGFNLGSWGNIPQPGLAGGLQAFLAARGVPNGIGGPGAGPPIGGAGGVMRPPDAGPSPFQPAPPIGGMPRVCATIAPQPGGIVGTPPILADRASPVNLNNVGAGSGPYGTGTPNFASGMSPFLAR
jgi:hypothetical protein